MATNATMTSLFDHQSEADAAQVLSMNGCLNSAGLAIKAGGSAIAKFANTAEFKINGKIYTKTTADLPLPVVTVAAGKKTVVAWFLDASGNITSAYATPVLVAEATPVLPAFADTKVCIGAALISNGTASNFVGATTALDTASLTVTYYNFANAFSGMTL
jgi:hypothetical protein